VPDEAIRFTLDGVPGFALGPYDGALRAAIVAMKRGARDPLDAFVTLLERAPISGALVPLPTTGRRVAERGFDQSVVIARRLATRRAIACVELLRKHGRPQAGRGRNERLAAHGRFRLRDDVVLPTAATLLDDVCTTGATLRDATHTLRQAGVDVVGLVVLARRGTPPRALRSYLS
jgi:predicted amidophosphoribosyltransferase